MNCNNGINLCEFISVILQVYWITTKRLSEGFIRENNALIRNENFYEGKKMDGNKKRLILKETFVYPQSHC